jgi:hypothetical protein
MQQCLHRRPKKNLEKIVTVSHPLVPKLGIPIPGALRAKVFIFNLQHSISVYNRRALPQHPAGCVCEVPQPLRPRLIVEIHFEIEAHIYTMLEPTGIIAERRILPYRQLQTRAEASLFRGLGAGCLS